MIFPGKKVDIDPVFPLPAEIRDLVEKQDKAEATWQKRLEALKGGRADFNDFEKEQDLLMRDAARKGKPDPRDHEHIGNRRLQLDYIQTQEEEARFEVERLAAEITQALRKDLRHIYSIAAEQLEIADKKYLEGVRDLRDRHSQHLKEYDAVRVSVRSMLKHLREQDIQRQVGHMEGTVQFPVPDETAALGIRNLKLLAEPEAAESPAKVQNLSKAKLMIW